MMNNPLTGDSSRRKRRVRQPVLNGSGDRTMVRYKSLGNNVSLSLAGLGVTARWYIPGLTTLLNNTAGPAIVSFYSTGLFKPGTHLRWEPVVSPTVGGRIFVGFTDNPEVAANITAAWNTFTTTPTTGNYATYAGAVKGLASTESVPLWQTCEWNVPTTLRRKRFDVNQDVTLTSIDQLDRSLQVAMFACIEGVDLESGVVGSFWFSDVVDVEGVHGTAT